MIRTAITGLIAILLALPAGVGAREIRIAISGEMAPFFYQSDSGWRGPSIDVARTVLERLGHTVVSIRSFPMARIAVMFRRGEIDLDPNWSPTPERQKVALFTTVPHVFETHSFIGRRGESVPYDGTMESLSGVRIAAMRGWTHGEAFDADESILKILVRSVQAQVRMLEKGRVQLAVQNPPTFFHEARNLGIDTDIFRVWEPPSVDLPVFMGVSRALDDAEAFRESLDDALAQFLQTEAYATLKKEHGF